MNALKLSVLAAVSVALAGCSSMNPTPFTESQVKDRVAADRAGMYADQEPILKPITFEEAAARALKYNLDYRLKLMETALAQGLQDVSRWDMMPRLLVGAGYASRSNDSGGRSIGIVSREETLSPSTSQERNHTQANVELSWNMLDFGVSYYRTKQKADQYLMAKERERKVIQNVLQDTRNAYWRALGAQKLIARVDDLMTRVEAALKRSRQAEQQGLLPQPTALAYQRALLDAVSLLSVRRQELELSRAELAALMTLPPGTTYTLADMAEPTLPPVPTNVGALEEMALQRRPELMEEWYRKRVTANDIKAAMILAMPGIQFDFLNAQYDSNRFLYNNSWIDSGISVSWNLFRLASLPALQRAHEAQNKTDDYRRMALGMAILTQVRIGVQRYALAANDLRLARESARVDARLLNYAKAAATTRVDSELEVIRAEARDLLTTYQQFASYSNAQSAWGRLYNSIGLDVLPEQIAGLDVTTLAQSIARTTAEWEQTTFQSSQPVGGAMQPLPVSIDEAPAGMDRAALAQVGTDALIRHEVLARSTGTPQTLRLTVTVQGGQVGTRTATVSMRLTDAEGAAPRVFTYAAVVGEVTQRALGGVVDAAMAANAPKLVAALEAAPVAVSVAPADAMSMAPQHPLTASVQPLRISGDVKMNGLRYSALVLVCGLMSATASAQTPAPEAMDPNIVRVMISPDKETTLAAPMNGRIKTLSPTLGSTFPQGRTLATFDCSENDARAKIAAAELKAARETYEAKVRLQGLQAAGDVEVNLAAAAVDRTVGQVELAQVQNAQCAVVAPFAGRVAKIFVRQYQGVNIGTPMAEIISNGPLKIRLNAPSRWLKTLKVGTPFDVAVDETGVTYAAKVSALGARVDVSAQTIEIEGQFTAVHPGLLAGHERHGAIRRT